MLNGFMFRLLFMVETSWHQWHCDPVIGLSVVEMTKQNKKKHNAE